MIKEHAVSRQGRSHIRMGTVCQDAYRIVTLANGFKVAAVADGVGSCKHADRGAQIAVNTVAEFVRDNFPIDGRPISVKSMLRTAYNRALIEIDKEARAQGNPLSDYDTTLMTVIYDGHHGYFAHVGDGGIVGLTEDGLYTELSAKQNSGGRVIPLRAGYEFWQIEEINLSLSSVLIATDGMMDIFRNVNLEQGFYVPLMMLFADPHCIYTQRKQSIHPSRILEGKRSTYEKVLLSMIYQTLVKFYRFRRSVCKQIIRSIAQSGRLFQLLRGVQDDRTVVCLYNTQNRPRARDIEYYKEPDWQAVALAVQRKLYPSMFSNPDDAAGERNRG